MTPLRLRGTHWTPTWKVREGEKLSGVTSARQEIGGVRPRCGETVTLQATNEERSPVPAAG